MKRLSRKIKKRFSFSTHDHQNSTKGIYGGVSQSRQLPIPQIPDRTFHSNYIYPPASSIDAASESRSRNASEPAPNARDEVSNQHDYSTLDGEEDVFEEGEENAPENHQHDRRRGLSSPPDMVTNPENCNKSSKPINSSNDSKDSQSGMIIEEHSLNSPMLREFQKLARQGWYWGPMTREQAEKKLSNAPEASFLVRDSSDERYILSLSFRSHHRTLHARIAHSGMKFSFYEDNPRQAYTSVIELIESSMRGTNEQGVFCYSRSRQPHSPTFPVRLIHPVSRFTEVRPLQDLCRFVIRQITRVDHIQNLPLPNPIKGYLNQSYF